MINSPAERLIVALDFPRAEEALALVEELRGEIGYYKIGMELFDSEGQGIVREVRRRGGEVFLDLKLHDIPTTVARTVRVLAGLGARMLNVHASGGRRMMTAAAEAVREFPEESRPKLLAVTVLTSLDGVMLREELGVARPLPAQVVALARLAQEAGCDGVVASPLEITAIREACGADFLIVTPGVRPESAAPDEQKRTLTPRQALAQGADYLVIGRPITRAADPRKAVREIIASCANIEKGVPEWH